MLAQAVLLGKTKGYRNHPQLERFRAQEQPVTSISQYLWTVYEEACRRGYCFDKTKIHEKKTKIKIIETDGQLLYEWEHLKNKLRSRSPEFYQAIDNVKELSAHPLFIIVPGESRSWEKRKK